jgi:hypothetical protein
LLQGKIGIEEKLPLMVGPFAPTADLDSTASGGSGFHSDNVRDRLATIATANPKIAFTSNDTPLRMIEARAHASEAWFAAWTTAHISCPLSDARIRASAACTHFRAACLSAATMLAMSAKRQTLARRARRPVRGRPVENSVYAYATEPNLRRPARSELINMVPSFRIAIH